MAKNQKKAEGVLRARPEGVRYCGRCGEMADHGRGQSACKECRRVAVREQREGVKRGAEALKRLTLG